MESHVQTYAIEQDGVGKVLKDHVALPVAGKDAYSPQQQLIPHVRGLSLIDF